MISALVWIHLVSTLYLVGLIWCVQVVHYPLMDRVDRGRFREFHHQHGLRISVIVVAPMVIEFASAVALMVWIPDNVAMRLPATGLVLVVLIWASTFGLQVPLHHKLAAGFDATAHRRLVRSNWIRTVAWSLRAAVAVMIAIRALAP